MISLNGLVMLSILAMIVGKHARQPKWYVYAIVVVVALVQVGIVLFDSFTLQPPIL